MNEYENKMYPFPIGRWNDARWEEPPLFENVVVLIKWFGMDGSMEYGYTIAQFMLKSINGQKIYYWSVEGVEFWFRLPKFPMVLMKEKEESYEQELKFKKRVQDSEYIPSGNKTHGFSGLPEFRIWVGMHSRCYKPENKNYKYYGEKGVIVCDRWHHFQNFLDDMGYRPDGRHSIDRINPYGNYSPENCRWATPDIQARNKRNAYLEMRYKGYIGALGFDKENRIYHGNLIGIGKDVVTFQGLSLSDAEKAFQDSVDDYIDFNGIEIPESSINEKE